MAPQLLEKRLGHKGGRHRRTSETYMLAFHARRLEMMASAGHEQRAGTPEPARRVLQHACCLLFLSPVIGCRLALLAVLLFLLCHIGQ